MQDFLGWGAQLKISGILNIHAAKRHVASSEAASLFRGVWGLAPQKKFLNGAIWCVLRTIFNHFHGKKSSQKVINKHEFFH